MEVVYIMQSNEVLLNEKQAAHIIGTTPRFLQQRRQAGTGPRFLRLSHRCVRYRQRDLDEWLDSLCKRSTSEA